MSSLKLYFICGETHTCHIITVAARCDQAVQTAEVEKMVGKKEEELNYFFIIISTTVYYE